MVGWPTLAEVDLLWPLLEWWKSLKLCHPEILQGVNQLSPVLSHRSRTACVLSLYYCLIYLNWFSFCTVQFAMGSKMGIKLV